MDKRFDENDKLQYLVQNADETTWIHDKELYREDDPTTCTCPAVLSAFEDGHDDSKAGSANLSSELPRLNEYARIYDRGLHAIIRVRRYPAGSGFPSLTECRSSTRRRKTMHC